MHEANERSVVARTVAVCDPTVAVAGWTVATRHDFGRCGNRGLLAEP
jgi:hypothetical protein